MIKKILRILKGNGKNEGDGARPPAPRNAASQPRKPIQIDFGGEKPKKKEIEPDPVYRTIFGNYQAYMDVDSNFFVNTNPREIPLTKNRQQIDLGKKILLVENAMSEFTPDPAKIERYIGNLCEVIESKGEDIAKWPQSYRVIINVAPTYFRRKLERVKANLKGHEEAHLAHGAYNGGSQ